jgi:hypothetical protein
MSLVDRVNRLLKRYYVEVAPKYGPHDSPGQTLWRIMTPEGLWLAPYRIHDEWWAHDLARMLNNNEITESSVVSLVETYWSIKARTEGIA